jgi:MFS family permease
LALRPGQPSTLNKNAGLRSAATAGLVSALLSFLPLGLLIGPMIGGFLSVLFYCRRAWNTDPPPSAGFRLGALSGLFGFVIFAVLAAGQTVLSHRGDQVREAMKEAVRRQQAWNSDPQVRQALEYFLTPQGLMIMFLVGLVFMGIVFVLASGLGASLSASLLRRKGPKL